MNEIDLREYIEKIIELRFRANEIALDKSTAELERRLEGLNDLRQEVVRDRSELVKKEAYETKIDLLISRIDNNDKRLTILETRLVTWSAAIMIIFTIIQAVLKFVIK